MDREGGMDQAGVGRGGYDQNAFYEILKDLIKIRKKNDF